MNLNTILSMLEESGMSGIEKTASDESKPVDKPAGADEITKTASAIKEAEELGAQVAAQLLKQAADEETKKEEFLARIGKKDDEKKEDKKEDEGKEEGKEDSKEEAKKEGESEEQEDKEKKEDNMDKKASLIDIITGMLEKSALEGDDNTPAGVPAGVVPNKAQVDSAAMDAGQEAMI